MRFARRFLGTGAFSSLIVPALVCLTLVLSSLTLSSCSTVHMLTTSKCIDGEWGMWDMPADWASAGTETNFVVYDSKKRAADSSTPFGDRAGVEGASSSGAAPADLPSDYCFKLVTYIDQFPADGHWHEYEGRIEFFVPESYLNKAAAAFTQPYDISKISRYFVENRLPTLAGDGVKISRPATIRVMKNRRELCYNVMFDNVGFGIDYETHSDLDDTVETLLWILLTVLLF